MQETRRKKNLRRRLMVWTLAGSLLPSIALMAVLVRLNYQRAKESLQRYVGQVAQQVGESARETLLQRPTALGEIVSALQEDPGFRGICFYNRDNQILLLHDLDAREALHLSGLGTRSFIELTEGRLAYRLVLGKGENLLGSLVLIYDTKELHSWAAETMWLAVLLLCVGAVLTLVVVNIMGRSLLRPINSIRDTALLVSADEDYGARARKYIDDELGDVCDAFNLMLGRIEERDQDLKEVKDELERRVMSRTRDLHQSKEKALEMAASLLESNRRIRAILETAADAIVSVDDGGRIESFNRAAEVMFGASTADSLGKSVTRLIPPERQAEYAQLLELQLVQCQEEDLVVSKVLEARRSDGEVFPVHLSLSAFKIGDEHKFTALIRDITEEKQTAAERAELNRKLVETSRYAGMAEVATGVLHNVGNVLNSLNLSAERLRERLDRSKLGGLDRVLEILSEHEDDLGTWLQEDGRGREILIFLDRLSKHLGEERDDLLQTVQSLSRNVDHIRQVVTQQQNFAKDPGVLEEFRLADLLDDALEIHLVPLERDRVELHRDYEDLPMLYTDKHRILQILVNLVSNAQKALSTCQGPKKLWLSVRLGQGQQIAEVRDNGPGIDIEHQAQIFNHGFTTRKDGHGFGLHSSANAAMELGGQLLMESPGRGLGATFRLMIPLAHKAEAPPRTKEQVEPQAT